MRHRSSGSKTHLHHAVRTPIVGDMRVPLTLFTTWNPVEKPVDLDVAWFDGVNLDRRERVRLDVIQIRLGQFPPDLKLKGVKDRILL